MAVISILATLTFITDDGKSLPGGVITLQRRVFKANDKFAYERQGFGHYAKLEIDGKRYQCTDNWLPIAGNGDSGVHPPSAKAEIHEVGAGEKAAYVPPTLPTPNRGDAPIDTGTAESAELHAQATNAQAQGQGVTIKRGKR